ncbi:MAG TPA: PrsW family glutamic-type intramembrane protease [Candidatus Paceibacterota bacterium]|nr:PrsW family glutamic-type intramembrane protease [Candidatus Paceibacterota bacterium]
MTVTTLGYAFIGGLLPPLIWLYFLLKEDARCPEPRALIALAFVAGMLAVPIALPLEEFAHAHLTGNRAVFTSWALIEETLKYVMAAVFILWRRSVDEAPDYVIYMITVALGFSAAENMLYLFVPLSAGQFLTGAVMDDLRFLGSSLIHVVSSATIGFALAFSAGYRPPVRVLVAALGLILAVMLHTAYNLLIINTGASAALTAFFLVWTLVVIFFAAFEVLKYFQYRNLPTNTC